MWRLGGGGRFWMRRRGRSCRIEIERDFCVGRFRF